MRSWRSLSCLAGMALLTGLPACQTAGPKAAGPAPAKLPELTAQSYLSEVMRYLYRWHLEEDDVEQVTGSKRLTFCVRRVEVKLDPGDQSLLAEIMVPKLGLTMEVRKANYIIEETGTPVQNETFKITEVRRGPVAPSSPPDCTAVELDTQEMIDALFRTRNQHSYADPVLVEHMRNTLRQELAKEKTQIPVPGNEPVVHLAPLSPVANETWVFWEAGNKLFYFSSDQDLTKPTVWDRHALTVRIYDLDQQVVLSHEEAPGSNRFLTRHEASRILFNCVVLGQRVTLPPLPPATQPVVGTRLTGFQ